MPQIDTSSKPIVWVLGGPGSGKGTQCDKIIKKYGFTHLSTGDLLRAEIQSGSPRAECLSRLIARGELVPNDLVLELLKDAMLSRQDTAKGFLIDGYPREKSQGIAFEETIAPVSAILFFECSNETLVERLLGRAKSSGRADDNEKTIKLRIKTFMDNNEEVIVQYPQQLRRINAEQSVDAIFAEVEKVLDPLVASAIKAMTKIDTSSKPIVWVLGGPGSGKGTQCDKIIKKYGFTHLSTGDLLRAEIKSGSPRAEQLSRIIEKGELVPNELVLELLKDAMLSRQATAKGFLIDGYPREKSQGIAFEKTIAPVSVILFFDCSNETLVKRLLGRAESSGRADDNEETIKLRIKTFMDNNEKVIVQYPQQLRRINAEQSVDAIFAEVVKALDPVIAGTTPALKALPKIDTSSKPIVWVLGGPGSGKGTQCDKIIKKYGFTHLSTGDLLRAEIKSGSPRAEQLSRIIEKGELVPNELVLELLKDAMLSRQATAKGFLIDGYPREKSQGIAFEKTIAPVSVILFFDCSNETLVKRLLGRAESSGRADDNEETIKLRIKTFMDNNEKVIVQYPKQLRRINAEQSVDAIFAEVEKVLDPLVASAIQNKNR